MPVFPQSPWFPPITGGLLLVFGMICLSTGAEDLGGLVMCLAVPFAFETGAWEEAVLFASRTYHAEWSEIHEDAYSTEGAALRYGILWVVFFIAWAFGGPDQIDNVPLLVAVLGPGAVWFVLAWIAHRRHIKDWVARTNVKSRY